MEITEISSAKDLGIRKLLNLGLLAKNKGFKFTNTFFPYTSGQIGPYYVNSEAIMRDGQAYHNAISTLSFMIKSELSSPYDVVSGGETRDWIFSNPVAVNLIKPHTTLYKDLSMIGADIKDKRVVHVADLNNEGSSPRDKWIPMLREGGATIEDIFFYVDRMEDGVQVMKDLGLNRRAVIELDEKAWTYLLDRNVLDREVYNHLRERMENKDAWAEKMLRSGRGFEAFVKLATGSTKDKSKAVKILEKGYPHLRDELVDRLNSLGIKLV